MRTDVIEPGTIWEAKPLTPDFLEHQWAGTLLHTSANLNLSELAFSKGDFEAWEWNAREVLYLNRNRKGILSTIRVRTVPQKKINFHLIHAYQSLISGWRQWGQLPAAKAASGGLSESNISFLLLSAQGRLEQAQIKQDSLNARKQVLQSVSLRQLRLYQQLTAILSDLDPIVKSSPDTMESSNLNRSKLLSLQTDILWHTQELIRLVGNFEHTPDLFNRILKPRMEINRLLGTVCQYYASYLKLLIN